MANDWTLLVYVGADDENTSGARETVSALLDAELPPGVSVMMQVDRRQGEPMRFLREAQGSQQRLTAKKDLSSAVPRTLRKFLEWGVTECPSENTCLVIWGHGKGILGSMPSAVSPSAAEAADGVAEDDTLTNGELRAVLQKFADANGKKLDLIAFHSCLMGSVEVAFELSEQVGYFVASEDEAKQTAWTYLDILKRLGEPRTVACSIVQNFGAQAAPGILAALDQSRLPGLASSIGKLGAALLRLATSGQKEAISNARETMIALGDANYVDLSSAAQALRSLRSADVAAAAERVEAALDHAVIKRAAVGQVHEAMGGVSLYFPRPGWSRGYLADYRELRMSKMHRGWSAFLDEFV